MVWPRKNILAEYTQPVTARFYAPEARTREGALDLPEDEARHLTRVLRLSAGARIRVFNGRGQEWHATVASATRQRVLVALEEPVAPLPEPRIAISLATAMLKGDKMDDVVRDAVMLGAGSIQPLVTARTEISPAVIERSGRVDRWRRIAVASAKQCGRAVVPEVRPAIRLDGVLAGEELKVMLAEPASAVRAVTLRDLEPPASATLIVGPEGGWTAGEVDEAAARGTMLLTLGTHTLRADAVPIVALTALRVRWEDF
jgi:16S rRNA (uracil1498-N3)-methyltransferase